MNHRLIPPSKKYDEIVDYQEEDDEENDEEEEEEDDDDENGLESLKNRLCIDSTIRFPFDKPCISTKQLPHLSTSTAAAAASLISSYSSSTKFRNLRKCMSVAYNPYGNYLVALHSDGDRILVPIYDFTTRVMSSCGYVDITHPSLLHDSNSMTKVINQTSMEDDEDSHGGTFFTSWSHNSKILLFAEKGSKYIFFMNNTHRHGPELATCMTVLPSSCYKVLFCPSPPPATTTAAFKRNSSKSAKATSLVLTTNHRKKTTSKSLKKIIQKTNMSNKGKDTIRFNTTQDNEHPSFHDQDNYDDDDDDDDDDSMNDEHMHHGYDIDVTKYTRSMIVYPNLSRLSSSSNVSSQQQQQQQQYQILAYSLPIPSSGTVQIHPNGTGGLACLEDGGLILFSLPKHPFTTSSSSSSTTTTYANTIKHPSDYYYFLEAPSTDPHTKQSLIGSTNYHDNDNTIHHHHHHPKNIYSITCATFAKNGNSIYATTSCSRILAFHLSNLELSMFDIQDFAEEGDDTTTHNPMTRNIHNTFSPTHLLHTTTTNPTNNTNTMTKKGRKPNSIIKIPKDPIINKIIVSNHGSMIVFQSTTDGMLRLYTFESIWNPIIDLTTMTTTTATSSSSTTKEDSLSNIVVDPIQIFESVTTVIPSWVDCTFSNDDKYFIAGYNHKHNKHEGGTNYEIYIWNVFTGLCIEKLCGPSEVELFTLSYHPRRPFIAVGTSDGIIDVWGPKMDWRAFAPSFQALESNVMYVEAEDEFDIVMDGDNEKEIYPILEANDEIVDVITRKPVDGKSDLPFYFEVAICSRNRPKRRHSVDLIH